MPTPRALTSAVANPDGCLCYAGVWREGAGPIYAGLIEVGPERLRLAGISPDTRVGARELEYRDLTGVRVGRAPDERLRGLPVLMLELGAQPTVEVGTLNGLGTLTELAELVALRVSNVTRSTGKRCAVASVESSSRTPPTPAPAI